MVALLSMYIKYKGGKNKRFKGSHLRGHSNCDDKLRICGAIANHGPTTNGCQMPNRRYMYNGRCMYNWC